MIKAEQIPDKAVDAMLESIGSFFSREEARAACAAMLNAWPGGWIHEREGVTGKTLSFPLTQENNNGSD
jgi:hypothetical protein